MGTHNNVEDALGIIGRVREIQPTFWLWADVSPAIEDEGSQEQSVSHPFPTLYPSRVKRTHNIILPACRVPQVIMLWFVSN